MWDLTTFHRRSSLFANTLFKAVLYHPDESQLVTAGHLLCTSHDCAHGLCQYSLVFSVFHTVNYVFCSFLEDLLQSVCQA